MSIAISEMDRVWGGDTRLRVETRGSDRCVVCKRIRLRPLTDMTTFISQVTPEPWATSVRE